jgi:hypothetical protein
MEEKELGSFETGIGLSDEFFEKGKNPDTCALYPGSFELVRQCTGLITEPGIYSLRLQLVKLK